MIGQTHLKNLLVGWAKEDSLPRFIILHGPRGCGKKTLADYVLKHTDYYMITPDDLKVDTVREVIKDARTIKSKTFILLPDADLMPQAAANALLKFLEEPPTNVYIILTVESLDNVLSTIKSRGQAFEMAPYSKEELAEFSDSWVTNFLVTPGQVLRAQQIDAKALLDLTEKVAFNIGKASAANVFKIVQSVDMENIDLFFAFLLHCLDERFKNNIKANIPDVPEIQRVVEMTRVVHEHKGLMRNKSINKDNLLEMFLVALRGAAL